MRLRIQVPAKMLLSATGLEQLSSSETMTLSNGAKLRPLGGGWYELWGYHYADEDVIDVYNKLVEKWHDVSVDSLLDCKKWRIHTHA